MPTHPASPDPSRVHAADEAAPGEAQTGDATCPACGGSGLMDASPCPECDGSGRITAIAPDA
jgi:DnaJ-class molecular chaperone